MWLNSEHEVCVDNKKRLSSWTSHHLFSRIPIFPMTPVYPRDFSTSVDTDLENGLATAIAPLTVWLLTLTIHVATWPAPQCICAPLPPPKPRVVFSKRPEEMEKFLPTLWRILEKNENSSFLETICSYTGQSFSV